VAEQRGNGQLREPEIAGDAREGVTQGVRVTSARPASEQTRSSTRTMPMK
jgi:hypothetical protein